MKQASLLIVFLLPCASTVIPTPGVSRAQFSSVAIDGNGFIHAAGSVTANGVTSVLSARVNPFGTRDFSYGNYGYLINRVGPAAQALSMCLTTNQMVLVGGAEIDAMEEFAIACYNNNGTFSNTFNGNGLLIRSIGTGAVLNSVAIDAQGKYVAAGIAIVGGAPLTIIARYNPDGTYDSAFGLTGIAMKRIFGNAGSYDIALQTSGKILAAGYAINPSGIREFALIRFHEDGSIDTSLGSVGTIVTPLGSDSCAYSLLSLPNNYIVCAGVSNNQSALVRYTPTGSLDVNFGVNGIVTTAIGSSSQINDCALQADGSLVAVGYSDTALSIMRYTAEGLLDTSFGTGGIVTTQIGQHAAANSLAIQNDGAIVVCGFCDEGAVIARYTASGMLDALFGNNGILIFPIANDAPDLMGLADVNIAADAAISYSKLNLASSIINSDISSAALIDDSKLQTIASPGKIDNRATSATSFTIPNGIVMRDTLGNFSANVISATLLGNVQGAASQNLLKNGDTMLGTLIVQPGSAQIPSLQFAENDQTGFSAQQNSISITTDGAQRILIDDNGSVTINAPFSGSALSIQEGGATIGGDISNSGNLLFNTQSTPLNVVGSTQGPAVKLFTGTDTTGLSGSVTIDYSDAGFANPPVICANALNGSNALITINNVSSSSATITSVAALNVPFNYIVVGM